MCSSAASARAVYAPTVAGLPVAHEECVRALDLRDQTDAEREAEQLRDALGNLRQHAGLGQRADTGIVVDDLPLAETLQRLHQPDDVRVVGAELVVRAVEADDEVA
jgi:hypothetical protein